MRLKCKILVICGRFGRGHSWHIDNFTDFKPSYNILETNMKYYKASQLNRLNICGGIVVSNFVFF